MADIEETARLYFEALRISDLFDLTDMKEADDGWNITTHRRDSDTTITIRVFRRISVCQIIIPYDADVERIISDAFSQSNPQIAQTPEEINSVTLRRDEVNSSIVNMVTQFEQNGVIRNLSITRDDNEIAITCQVGDQLLLIEFKYANQMYALCYDPPDGGLSPACERIVRAIEGTIDEILKDNEDEGDEGDEGDSADEGDESDAERKEHIALAKLAVHYLLHALTDIGCYVGFGMKTEDDAITVICSTGDRVDEFKIRTDLPEPSNWPETQEGKDVQLAYNVRIVHANSMRLTFDACVRLIISVLRYAIDGTINIGRTSENTATLTVSASDQDAPTVAELSRDPDHTIRAIFSGNPQFVDDITAAIKKTEPQVCSDECRQ